MANDTVAYRQSDGRNALNIDTNKTLAISDNGVVQNLVADGVIITLPATVLDTLSLSATVVLKKAALQ